MRIYINNLQAMKKKSFKTNLQVKESGVVLGNLESTLKTQFLEYKQNTPVFRLV